MSSITASLITASALSNGCGPTDCARDSDCSSGQVCLYPPRNCSAQGECKSIDQSNGCAPTATCGAIEELCGCDGTMVMTGCGYPDGWTTGPTPSVPNSDCSEQLVTAVDAGPEAGVADAADAASGDGADAVAADAGANSETE